MSFKIYGKRTTRSKKKATFRWVSEWTVLWVIGGFVLAYFVAIIITGDKAHPIHWLFAILGGVTAYGIELLIVAGLPPVVRFIRYSSRRMALKQGREKQVKKGRR